MASTAGAASESHSLPSSLATLPTDFLDDHPRFLRSPSSPTFPDGQAAAVPSFYHCGVPAVAAAAAQEQPPSPVAERKPPRKRPRASRRPPTTVLTTDASNFRAMVQEFTGFPAPPPFAGLPHILSGGGLFPSPGSAAQAFQLPMRASPATCTNTNTTPLMLDALALFAKTNAIAAAAAAAAAGNAPHSWGSELYGRYGPVLAGAVPFDDDDFEVAEDESAGAGHELFSSPLHHAGERHL
ncbi:hypothetical protein GUJ93_ZPchr0007g5244 [Zizania palustris]|uniref:VQ domain-containing protein n=1 Tax=Zizania palustris TaxID=103762 RepID=A0A8J5T6V6_ZIZPA|nr:hypothetical protein GUJ93_ZPchr0007g5244 [Zizania palustris]